MNEPKVTSPVRRRSGGASTAISGIIESPSRITRSSQQVPFLSFGGGEGGDGTASTRTVTILVASPARGGVAGAAREVVVVGGGGLSVESVEERRSPLRRSQTSHTEAQHVALTYTSGSSMGVERKIKEDNPFQAVRVGEQYQLSDGALPPCPPGNKLREPEAIDVARVAAQYLVWSVGDAEESLAQAFEAKFDKEVTAGRINGRETALPYLKICNGDMEGALDMARETSAKAQWSKEEKATFLEGMNEYDKNFARIKELLPKRSLKDVISYFYVWKQTKEYKTWKEDRPLQFVEQAIPDYHAEVCDECEKPGDLLCCDTCNLAFHMHCIGLRERDIPDDFSCKKCLEHYKHPADRERAKRWVENQVRRVMSLREKELAKLQGAPPGYIARSRPRAKTGKKRKRELIALGAVEEDESNNAGSHAKVEEVVASGAASDDVMGMKGLNIDGHVPSLISSLRDLASGSAREDDDDCPPLLLSGEQMVAGGSSSSLSSGGAASITSSGGGSHNSNKLLRRGPCRTVKMAC